MIKGLLDGLDLADGTPVLVCDVIPNRQLGQHNMNPRFNVSACIGFPSLSLPPHTRLIEKVAPWIFTLDKAPAPLLVMSCCPPQAACPPHPFRGPLPCLYNSVMSAPYLPFDCPRKKDSPLRLSFQSKPAPPPQKGFCCQMAHVPPNFGVITLTKMGLHSTMGSNKESQLAT